MRLGPVNGREDFTDANGFCQRGQIVSLPRGRKNFDQLIRCDIEPLRILRMNVQAWFRRVLI